MSCLIDIEDLLVWSYAVEHADRASPQERGPGWPRDSVLRLECVGLGGLSGIGARQGCHTDAETVHAAVSGLSAETQRLVIGHARSSTRPEWFPGARQVIAAELTRQGRPRKLYDHNRHVTGHAVRAGVELGDGSIWYDWTMDGIGRARAVYTAWHQALTELAAWLDMSGLLVDYQVSGPAAADSPWENFRVDFSNPVDKPVAKSY